MHHTVGLRLEEKNFYDSDTDQWYYNAVCCKELNYDDQGHEWCGLITRAGNTETYFDAPP